MEIVELMFSYGTSLSDGSPFLDNLLFRSLKKSQGLMNKDLCAFSFFVKIKVFYE
jgi:hypothetical protein